MKFKKTIQTLSMALALGLILWLGSFGVGQNWALAVVKGEDLSISIQSSVIPSSAIPSKINSEFNSQGDTQTLKNGVDRFLQSIPSGYYTIASVGALKTQLQKSPTLLIDVREPSEYRAGHIPHAINIPLRTLSQNLDKIDGDRPVIVYCSTGYRSAMGVMTLHLLGYDHVQGFPPSFAGWKNAGEEIQSGNFSE
jgi:rhodanese-related sulfurtransferase